MAEPESLPATNAYPTGNWDGVPLPAVEPELTSAHLLAAAAGYAHTETAVPHGEDTDVDPAPNLPQIPGYRVLRPIGNGGMGTVFKAVQLNLNRVVALKLINSGWAGESEFRSRFDREVKTLAAIEHPNIVPVYDAGAWQGLSFLTMKFVTGKTLHHHIEAIRRDRPRAVRLVVEVARAVQFLHTRNIIHRDLKPLNILLTEDGTPLVADFGLVKPMGDDSDLSMTMVPLGTRQYMSPEQTRGGRANYTPACDIWALGVILYELLAGRRPFSHDDPMELFGRIRRESPPPIPAESDVPPALEAITRRCLEKQPADRYATAGELADDLERWLNGEAVAVAIAPAVEAPPPKPVRSSRRPRRVLVAVCAAALLAVIAVAAGAFRPPTLPDNAPPSPPALVKTRLDRFNAGEPIVITDAKGKLTGEAPFQAPGHEVGVRTRGGWNEYFARDPGFTPLCDGFPIPYRVTADLWVSGGKAQYSTFAVYAGRKAWGGPVPHGTFTWFGIKPAVTPELREYSSGIQWWESDTPTCNAPWHDLRVPPPAVRPGDPHFVPIEIEVREDRIVGRTANFVHKPFATADAIRHFSFQAHNRVGFKGFVFHPPMFGTGVGLYLREADGVAANVTVSKIVP